MRATVGVLLGLLKGSLAMELLDSHTALEPFSCHKHGFNYTLRYPRYDERFRHAHSMNRCGYNFYPEARRVPLPAVMIDVGANVGQSLLGYASLGWQILAFEPMPLNAVIHSAWATSTADDFGLLRRVARTPMAPSLTQRLLRAQKLPPFDRPDAR